VVEISRKRIAEGMDGLELGGRRMTTEEYSRLRKELNLSRFSGKWVVLIDRKVVASGKDPGRALSASRKKYPKKKSLLLRVPKKQTLVL